MSDNLTWDAIAPLIAEQSVQGRMVHVVFRCPVSGITVPSRATIQQSSGIGATIASSAQRNVMWSLRSALARTLRNVFGYSLLGRIAADAADSVVSTATSGATSNLTTPGQKKAATIEAFQAVVAHFQWDEPGARWVSASAEGVISPFDRQVQSAPVTSVYDRGVLFRMLVELAKADGTVAQEERDFLFDFATADLDPLDEVLSRPPLSPVELSETTPGPTRETMLMLAWSLALTDENLDDAERHRLDELSTGLGLPAERSAAVRDVAQRGLVEQMVQMAYGVGERPEAVRESARELATRIGMSPDEGERVEIQYRKAHNLL